MPRLPSRLVAIAVLSLVTSLLPAAALAQQVVVLEFKGDARGAVRTQLSDALKQIPKVEEVPLATFVAAARKRGFRANRLANDAAVKAIAPGLGVEAVVTGELREGRLFVQIFDAAGQGIWSRELPLVNGRLSDDSARRLASAVSVAATPAAPAPAEAEVPAQAKDAPAPAQSAPTASQPPPAEAPAAATQPPAERAATPPPAPAAASPGADLPRPALITGFLTGTTTWRGYCARPGVQSCGEYDVMPVGGRPIGETVTFTSYQPYAGYALAIEVFPLARSDAWFRNAGLHARFGQAWSASVVRVQTTDTSTAPETVVSTDLTWGVEAGYRHHFFFGADRLVGHAGARVGVAGHAFVPEEGTLFGASRRLFPTLGVDGAIPLHRRARVEAGAELLLNPRAGEDELSKYGARVSALGFAVHLGASGDVWGPLGYFVRVRYEGYSDTFKGTGALWSNGGVAQELYATILWGVSARY